MPVMPMRHHGKRHLHVARSSSAASRTTSSTAGPSSQRDASEEADIDRNLDPDADLPASKRRLEAGRRAASALVSLSQQEAQLRNTQAARSHLKIRPDRVEYQPDDDLDGLEMEEVIIEGDEELARDELAHAGPSRIKLEDLEPPLFRSDGDEEQVPEEMLEMEDVVISDVEVDLAVKPEPLSDEEVIFIAESAGQRKPAGSPKVVQPPPRTPSPRPGRSRSGEVARRSLSRNPSSTSILSSEGGGADEPGANDDSNTAAAAGPSRPRPGARRRSSGQKSAERTLLLRTDPWPEHFLQLEQTFKAINVVHTFCSGRKHLAPTFNTMKSSVESYTGRPLEVFELAQLKSLCPDLINFAYVDAELLQVHLDGSGSAAASEDMTSQTIAGSSASNRRIDRDNVYAQALEDIQRAEEEALGLPADSSDQDEYDDEGNLLTTASSRKGKDKAREVSDHVLLFDFNDGTTQGAKARGSGLRPGFARAPQRERRKLKRPPINSLPSGQSMTKLIEKRNQKFEQAVLELLKACEAKGEDAVQLIIEAAQGHLPIDPSAARLAETETPKKKRIKLKHLMENQDARSAICDIVGEMKLASWWNDQIVPGGRKTLPARQAQYGELDFELSQRLVDALWNTRKIEHFYTHQAQALNALNAGQNVIISTSTSSGKSLVYQVPVLRALEESRDATAIYIFPTKALSQDQQRTLQELLHNFDGLEDIVVSTYDGDLPKEDRREVRETANVIFTNPDMLHQSILPFEDKWRRFFENLRFVVVDELHIYNGLFGAHVGFVLRRLRRICHALGNDSVQFVSCSATVSNPRDHMSAIVGVNNVEVVTEDGSPVGKKEWVIWNPPQIDPDDPAQGRVSAYEEASKVFRHLVEHGVRTILFCKVRRTCEIVIRQIRNDLALEGRQDVANKVMAYRSGYSPQDRRKIEQDMFKGQLLGIVATTALELGIDIGTLDAVVMLGFPYSISGLRQQAGRAGRRQKDSLALLIGEPWPMDQHYMRFPEEIFSQPDAALTVDLTNDFVVEAHMQCAAAEMPLHPVDDAPFFGPSTEKICKTRLTPDDRGFFHCRQDLLPTPARDVAIRGARQESYSYIDDTPGRQGGPRVMEEVEIERAIFEAFEGAVFMHQGHSYICRSISHDTRVARMYRADVNYHTRPRDYTDTDAVQTYRIRSLRESPYKAYFGKVVITNKVWGYFKVDRRANILDSVDVDCPPYVRETRGMWLDVPMWLVQALTEKTINAAAAIHAAEHALLSLTPMFVVSIAGDVQTECKIAEKEYAKKVSTRRRPARLIFYDLPGQNAGICERAFEHLDALLRIAIAVIEACHCTEGCPGCVTSQTCAYANVVTSKVGALAVLRGLVGRQIFDDDLPQQNDPGHASGQLDPSGSALTHTIREASPVRGQGPLETEDIEEQVPEALLHFGRIAAEQAVQQAALGLTNRRAGGASTSFVEEEGDGDNALGPEEGERAEDDEDEDEDGAGEGGV
ncbi:ATP-dependent 3'-5' DNA helicase [Tilletia horrida]|uniref:ATP-dependent 3'-5' DNA helicase n=1 Tax=Tilletia horrida TaxID=155126 RepID=A0AAN6GGB9_9BASI|nr:ATP-dependent 3'-5' DNA helicase [Tilletia horrida]